MYRGAVPITERPLPDDLEPLRGTVWSGGIQTPQRHYAPGASLALRSVPLWGWGVCETAPRFPLYPFSLARRRHTYSCPTVNTCRHAIHSEEICQICVKSSPTRMVIVKNRLKSSFPRHTACATRRPRPRLSGGGMGLIHHHFGGAAVGHHDVSARG